MFCFRSVLVTYSPHIFCNWVQREKVAMNALTVKLFFSFCISFLLTFYFIPIFCIVAQRLQFVDVPDGKIKRHEKSTPYLGGMAIYCGFLCTLAFVLPFGNQMGLLLIGTTLLLFLGLIDDFIILKDYQNLKDQTSDILLKMQDIC